VHISAKTALGSLAVAGALAFAVFTQLTVSRLHRAVRAQGGEAARLEQDLQALRAEVDVSEERVHDSLASISGRRTGATQFPPGSDEAIEAEIVGWLGRVAALRRAFDEHPEERIPEMALLTEREWKKVANVSTVRHSELDANGELHVDFTLNFAPAREIARTAFLEALNDAILRCKLELHGEMPSDFDQLTPFLPAAVDPSVRTRYDFSNDGGRVSITEKSTPVFGADERLGILEYGQKPRSWQETPAERAIREANQRYAAAHGGANATNPEQLTPFLGQPVAPALLVAYFTYHRRTAPAAAATPP
jgi:hypothetical protein